MNGIASSGVHRAIAKATLRSSESGGAQAADRYRVRPGASAERRLCDRMISTGCPVLMDSAGRAGLRTRPGTGATSTGRRLRQGRRDIEAAGRATLTGAGAPRDRSRRRTVGKAIAGRGRRERVWPSWIRAGCVVRPRSDPVGARRHHGGGVATIACGADRGATRVGGRLANAPACWRRWTCDRLRARADRAGVTRLSGLGGARAAPPACPRAGERDWSGRRSLRPPDCSRCSRGACLEGAVRSLDVRFDSLVVDATGRDHLRSAGLALQLGAVLDLATVGVTHRPLLAQGVWSMMFAEPPRRFCSGASASGPGCGHGPALDRWRSIPAGEPTSRLRSKSS